MTKNGSRAVAALAACVALALSPAGAEGASGRDTCSAGGDGAPALEGLLDARPRDDEPLDPRSIGWGSKKKSKLPLILAIAAGVVSLAAIGVGIYLWQDARVRFPNDTVGVQSFRP